jgi:colanic acid biosynthesis glycosyl transferase WcaI
MKLNVTIWGINYAPEVAGIGPYNTALCKFLVGQGHTVRMVSTFPYYPSWKKAPADRGRLYRTDEVDGVTVHRCWHFVPSKPTALKRILHEASFVLFSFLRLLLLPRPDVFVVVSPPLLLGASAWLLSWLKKAPYILHIQDLQPDAAVGMGMLKPGLFIRTLYRLESFAYAKAHRVSGISQGMCSAFRKKGMPDRKIVYFPNGVLLPGTAPAKGEFRKRAGLSPEQFVAVYSGNLGVKQGLEVVIEAAQLLADSQIRLVICGEGARREFLASQIAAHRLSNVTMLPLQSAQRYEEMLADADVSLITQQKGSGASFFPSKLLSQLAFSKPVLTVADESSELVAALKRGQFGLNVEPGNPQAFAGALKSMAGHPERLAGFAKAGFQYVEQFELHRVLTRFEQELVSLVTGPTIPAETVPTNPRSSTDKPAKRELVGI